MKITRFSMFLIVVLITGLTGLNIYQYQHGNENPIKEKMEESACEKRNELLTRKLEDANTLIDFLDYEVTYYKTRIAQNSENN